VGITFDQAPLHSGALVAGLPDAVRGTMVRLAVRRDREVQLLDESHQVLKSYPIPDGLRGQDFTFAETTTGEALMFWNSPTDEVAPEIEYRIYWVSEDGHSREARTALAYLGYLRPMQVCGAAVVPSPLVLSGLVAFGRSRDLLQEGLAADPLEAVSRSVTEFWPALALAQMLAAALALLCHRRQVRYGASPAERLIWPLFVLALGLPGWIGYRFGRAWPVLEACPGCSTTTPRDRGDCVRCEAEFPEPSLKGTEVFA
jgi:hypothetical protein